MELVDPLVRFPIELRETRRDLLVEGLYSLDLVENLEVEGVESEANPELSLGVRVMSRYPISTSPNPESVLDLTSFSIFSGRPM